MCKHIFLKLSLFIIIIFLGVFLYPYKTVEAPEVKTGDSFLKNLSDEQGVLKTFEYIEIIAGCEPNFEGECGKVYSKPDLNSKVVAQLRNGVVLKVDNKVMGIDGSVWYKVKFEKVLYPERILGDWYISQNVVKNFFNIGDEEIPYGSKIESNQLIVIVLSEQKLYAYEDDNLVISIPVSTGFNLTPTPVGNFTVFMKKPSRYMQAPQLNVEDYYDLPGVPWNLYFDQEGDVIHGAYWHNSFGQRRSHGCVNLAPSEAKKLYAWVKLGASVRIEP